MSYILDILAIIIIVGSIISGHKKGFVKTVLKLCSGIICLVLAISFSPTIGAYINENCVMPFYEKTVSEKFESIAPSESSEAPDISKIAEEEPNEFVLLLEKYNIDVASFKEFLSSFSEEKSEQTTELAIEYVAKPISETVSYIISFIVILIVSSILLWIIAFILDSIVKLPVFRTANKFLGIVCGLFFGVLWVCVVATVLEYALPYINACSSPLLKQMTPDKTLLFHYFYYNNPVSEIIKAFF